MEFHPTESLATVSPGRRVSWPSRTANVPAIETRHAGLPSSGQPKPHQARLSPNGTLIQSVQRALHLTVTVAEGGQPQPAKQLARRTGIALPTAYHLLRTLIHEGFLEKTKDGYILGPMATALFRRQQTPASTNLVQAEAILRSLSDVVGGSAYLSVFRSGEFEIVLAEVARSMSLHELDLWPGVQPSGHATAFGKCILAHLDPMIRRDYLIRHELSYLTPKTVTDTRALDAGLATCATLATDREEYRLGISCIAVPVVTGDVIGAVAISARSSRYDVLVTHLPALRVAADAIGFAIATPR
jgi:IclR family transcriptional regulator, acetate operon repressor